MREDLSSTRTCIHSRKISSFLDDSGNEKFGRFKRHLDRCSFCRTALAKEQGLISEIEEHIPVLSPSCDIADGIRSEIVEAFRGVDIEKSRSLRDKVLSLGADFFDWCHELGRMLLSRQMILTYLFSICVGLLLKFAL